MTQFQFCEENFIPLAVVVGENELQTGVVSVRFIEERRQIDAIPRSEMAAVVKALLAKLRPETASDSSLQMDLISEATRTKLSI